MPFDPDRVRAVTFDSYSTIVDVDSAERALAGRVDDPGAVAGLWRGRSLTYAAMANYVGDYEPFWELVRRGLEYALSAHGTGLDGDELDAVLAVYHDLDPFDDVRPGMERLADLGYDLHVVSNGSPDMLETMIEAAGIGDLLGETVSADEVQTYKIHPEIYRHAAARTGTPARRIAHASAGWFDAVGAMNVGMQGVWVNRRGAPPETWGPTPDLTVTSFHELADALA